MHRFSSRPGHLVCSLTLLFVVACGDLPTAENSPKVPMAGCDARPPAPDSVIQDTPIQSPDLGADAPATVDAGQPPDGEGAQDARASHDAGVDAPPPDAALPDTALPDAEPDCVEAGMPPATVVILPDTQYYAGYYPAIFEAQANFIVGQKQPRNFAAVVSVGDVVDNIFNDAEWVVASRALRKLDGLLPYILIPGNHDQDGNRNGLMNKYFPPSSMTWLSGTMVPGQSENSYTIVDIGGRKWLVLGLEFGPRNKTVAWADAVLKAYGVFPVILTTHAYLFSDGTRYDWATKGTNQVYNPHWYNPTPTEGVNDGEELYQKLIVPNPNVRIVLSGHINTPPWALAHRSDVRPQGGAPVHQLVQNFQSNTNGGDGYLLTMQFDYEAGLLRVETYSPTLDKYITDESGRFTLPLVP